ncbi:autophagy protein, partial [Cladochytrium tenue]
STICELTFVTAILAVKLNRKRLIVVLEEHVYIYDIGNMKLLHTIDTSPNPNALCVLSPSSENCYIAYPPNTAGASGDLLIFDAVNLQAMNIIPAHKSPLSCVSFNFDGTMIATSSDKGTVIRVFSVPTGAKLFQFRRGTYSARIYSLAFDISSTLLAVSSDSDTVHVFRLQSDAERAAAEAAAAAHPEAGVAHRGPTRRVSGGAGGSSAPAAAASTGSPSERRLSAIMKTGIGSAERTLTSVYDSIRSPFASATSALSSYIVPDVISEMWEPQRDFAHARLPASARGQQNICAIGSIAPPSPAAADPAAAATASSLHMAGSASPPQPPPPPLAGSAAGGSGALTAVPNMVMVATASGQFFQFAIDLEAGGECAFQRECSLVDDV